MHQIIDYIMTGLFVLFMVFMVRGFMLQSAQKNRDKRHK